jgi:hypothetical protein
VDPRDGLDDFRREKLLTLPGLGLRPFGHPARSQSLYRLRYPGLMLCNTKFYFKSSLQFELQVLNFSIYRNIQ